jgi:hypothetical protein
MRVWLFEAAAHANEIPGEPLWYGLAGLLGLLALLYIVTRFNPNR